MGAEAGQAIEVRHEAERIAMQAGTIPGLLVGEETNDVWVWIHVKRLISGSANRGVPGNGIARVFGWTGEGFAAVVFKFKKSGLVK